MKNPRRLAALAALCVTVALAGWVAAGLAGLDSPSIESAGAPIEVSRATSATARAEHVDAPQATAPSTPDPVRKEAKEATGSVEVADGGRGSATLSNPPTAPRPATGAVLLAAVSPTDPVQTGAKPPLGSDALDACHEPDVCIDQYLWSLYERTQKVDTVKLEERIKVKVKTKGKTRTVVKTLIKYITEDFGWKDPKAAQKAGMSLKDYVIGGMDRGFKRKLYSALRAMADAGFSPGITSGFRDDYRQELARGNKAAADSSYHGGSRRGGYGHGLAADIVSVKGGTRAERCASSEILWKWIDAREKELGVARPYLDRDPPHVAPLDGKEYADKRGSAKARLAGLKKPSPSSNPK
ncbi:MAG: peptidase M15 [Pseudolabrys sp.]